VSDAKWYGSGVYSRTRNGREVFYVRVWVPSEKRMRYSKTTARTAEEAQQRLGAIKVDPEKFFAKRDARPAPKAPSFEALVKAFLAGYHSRGDSGYYEMVSVSWLDHFGKTVRADKITRAMVEDYRDSLRRAKYGDSTVRKYVGALGTMYRWAIGRGVLTVNPVLDVRRPSEPDREVAVLNRDQEADLLKATERDDRIVVRLFLESGMRFSEGLELRWSQVDRAGGAILIDKSKTGKARSIPLNARLTAVLDDATRHVRSDFVLCDREGKPLDRFVLARRVESALERADVAKVKGTGFNLFRHTFGSRLAEQGVSMATIATIMGNSEAVCMRHYVRFSPAHLKAAMATLDTPTVAGSVAGPRGMVNSGSRVQSEAVAS
jgi:site-specific recombinase XerD